MRGKSWQIFHSINKENADKCQVRFSAFSPLHKFYKWNTTKDFAGAPSCSNYLEMQQALLPLQMILPPQTRPAKRCIDKKPTKKESRWNIIIIHSGDIYSHFLHVPARDTAKSWQPSGNYKKRNCVRRTSARFVKFSWQFLKCMICHGPELHGYCRSDPE